MLDNESSIAQESLVPEARARFDQGLRLAGVTATPAAGGQGLELLYHFDRDLAASHLRLALPDRTEVPSLAGVFPGARLDEAEIRGRFGVVFRAEPPTVLSAARAPNASRFASPGLSFLALDVEGQTVVRAEPDLGAHVRDLERIAESRAMSDTLPLARRICGLCSYGHGLSFCLGVEALLGVSVPPRAQALRILWAELHRVASHLFWMARLARFLGAERLFAHCLRVRERVLAVLEASSADRIIASVVIVGGVGRDIDPDQFAWITQQVASVERGLRDLEKPLLDDYVLGLRTRGVGLLTREQARAQGAVGPTLRASGWDRDVRSLGLAGYDRLDFTPCFEPDGDVHSRIKVRLREALVSCDLARQCLAASPEGEIAAPVVFGPLEGEVWVRVEQPRGEQYVYMRGDGADILSRVRVRTAARANLAPLLAMLPGLDLQEAALVALSTDPCEACQSA